MSESLRNLPHLNLPRHPSFQSREDYTYPRKVVDKRPNPVRNRGRHANKLRSDLGNVLEALEQERKSSESKVDVVGEPGFYLDVEFSASEKDKVLQSIENLRGKAKIELMSVSVSPSNDKYLEATLFVPDSKKNYFEKKITAYENEETKKGKPKHEALVSRIEAFSLISI
jgi:hypothetical protein